MPIKPLLVRQRHAELGRIRLGYKAATGNGGTRPAKLETFRFTSPGERYINDLAALYGGQPRPWDNDGKPEFEVYTEAKSIPFIVIKAGLSQWMETWSGGGVRRRCDGEFLDPRTTENQTRPCICAQEGEITCKPTTRLSGMLPELEALGSWRLESKGWNAAAEIPAVAELAGYVGDLVPAHLNLVERRSVRAGTTSRFVVPVLDLQIGAARLREVVASVSGTAPAIASSNRLALESGQQESDPYEPYFERLEECTTVTEAQALWSDMVAEHLVGRLSEPSPRREEFGEAFKVKAATYPRGDQPATGEPDADGVVDAEIVDDADAVWQRILAEGGRQGLDLDQVRDSFKAQMGGLLPDDASAPELEAYLAVLVKSAAA